MKIVFLSDDFPPRARGGAGIAAFRLAQGLARAGNEVHVITTAQDTDQETAYNLSEVRVVALPTRYHHRWRAYRGLYNPDIIRRLDALLRELRPDVVHAHNVHFYLSYFSLRVARRYASRVFLTAHDVMLFHYGKFTEYIHPETLSCDARPPYRVSALQLLRRFGLRYNPLRNWCIRWMLRSVTRIFAVSAELARALAENGISGAIVAHNGVDITQWQRHGASDVLQRLGLEGKEYIFFGGRMSPLKGGEQMIRAFARASGDIPSAMLLIAGGGVSESAPFLTLAESLGVREKIIVSGWLSEEDVAAVMCASRCVVMPSICFDTFGLVVLEAMASSRPVVASCFGGARELVRDGETGFLVNPYMTDIFARRLRELLSDSVHGNAMGVAGRDRAEHFFTLDRLVRQMLAEYRA